MTLSERHRMRILFLSEGNAESWDSWSGISKSIVEQLRVAGHAVRVGDVDLYGAERWAAAAATVSLDRRRWATRFHLTEVPFRLRSRQARRLIQEHRDEIDIIVQVGSTFTSQGPYRIPYCLCCDSNIGVAQQAHATGVSDAAALTPEDVERIASRERDVYRGAAAIFPLSERLRRSFIDDFGISGHRVTTIYAGPNLELDFVQAAAAGPRTENAPTVLFVGRQFYRKGADVLIDAFRQVRARLPNARLLIAGLPADAIAEPGIVSLGDLNKNSPEGAAALAAAYRSADVFALPTRFEPFGIAFVEAMHFGLPCIGPRAWAVPEIIADGETGFTVAVDDVNALTGALQHLLTNTTLARRMGEAGRERARSLFTWPKAVGRMLDAMLPIVNQPGARIPAVAASR
jgi:glycosyltransferase involved in cell wall biosynthesis